ncbi:MAG: trehalose-phosphatase [Steroidobacteraceae bacterium]
MTLRGPFVPERNIALFLDVDGTLLEIASTPDAVKVPAALCNTLQLAAAHENGALALVSGRSISELDRLFAPCVFPAAGQHGLERRNADGKVFRPPLDTGLLSPAREMLSDLQLRNKGLLLEDKGTALAMHYRLAPQYESIVREVMTAVAEPLTGQFVLRAGKCVLELAPAGYSKRTAIEAFMAEKPFAGRVPVFVGDDVTDEDGFAAVNALGGHSIRVGHNGLTAARHCFGSVSAVIAWLRERNINP